MWSSTCSWWMETLQTGHGVRLVTVSRCWCRHDECKVSNDCLLVEKEQRVHLNCRLLLSLTWLFTGILVWHFSFRWRVSSWWKWNSPPHRWHWGRSSWCWASRCLVMSSLSTKHSEHREQRPEILGKLGICFCTSIFRVLHTFLQSSKRFYRINKYNYLN